jgi:glycosyltransferase involved in cell wall biosynthesis
VPLDFRDKLAWNKSENKLLGLWILGIPVLASPTPSYSRVALEAGVKNCIVNDGDWALALSRVMNNPALRLDNINNGRAYAEQIGSAQATDYGWGKVLESVGLL